VRGEQRRGPVCYAIDGNVSGCERLAGATSYLLPIMPGR
jgi:hypothetical protein